MYDAELVYPGGEGGLSLRTDLLTKNPDSTCFSPERLLHRNPSLLQLPLPFLYLLQLPLDDLPRNSGVSTQLSLEFSGGKLHHVAQREEDKLYQNITKASGTQHAPRCVACGLPALDPRADSPTVHR